MAAIISANKANRPILEAVPDPITAPVIPDVPVLFSVKFDSELHISLFILESI